MSYIKVILTAVTVFPIIALIITLPYILIQYHKYGSVQNIRVAIVYSFIFYLLTAYFLVILPLPPIEEVALYKSDTMQLIPFQFITTFIENTRVTFNDPTTYIYFLKDPCSYQVLYNLFLTIPFGIYLRYYYNFSFKKTFILSFLFSLFFELTQLSGLYFIYPRGYRLFDVDDLIINTLGGIIGYFIAPLLEKILPTREELDQKSKEKGTKIPLLRRFFSFSFDFFINIILIIVIYTVTEDFIFSYIISIFIYNYLIPCFTKGKTIFQKFFNLKINTYYIKKNILDEKTSKIALLLRMIWFYYIFLPLPYYFYLLSNYLFITYEISSYLIFIFIYIIIIYFNFLRPIIKEKDIFYEKISRTKLVSTIKVLEKEEDNNEEECYN